MTTIAGFWHAAAQLSGRIDWSDLIRNSQPSPSKFSPEQLCAAGIPKRYVKRLHQTEELCLDGEAIVIDSPTYPPALRNVPFAPPVLFYKGNVDLLPKPCIAIVGARKCTQSGQQIARTMAAKLADSGLVVTSGMAYGIDTAAHQAARGHTIAVLGQGIHQCQRSSQSKTMSMLLQDGGLVISEFPPFTPARRHTFPQRNRVIAGMSIGTIIVEASLRSGSRITARNALEYGREVMAVPGHPFSSASKGTNELIRQGALLVRDADDVLQELGFERTDSPSNIPESNIAKVILAAAENGLTFDELQMETGLPTPKLITTVESHELTGWLQRLPGGRICARK